MMKVTDVLKLLSENPEASFLEFCQFNDKPFGACSLKGVSPGWEMHPDTDEFFYVIEGTIEITLLEQDQARHYIATAGSSFVVPRGIWHKPGAPEGAKFIYFTPGQSLYSEKEDPRIENDA